MKKSLKRIIIVCLITYFSLFMLTSCAIEDVFPFIGKQNNGDATASIEQVETAVSESADATNSGNTRRPFRRRRDRGRDEVHPRKRHSRTVHERRPNHLHGRQRLDRAAQRRLRQRRRLRW